MCIYVVLKYACVLHVFEWECIRMHSDNTHTMEEKPRNFAFKTHRASLRSRVPQVVLVSQLDRHVYE